MAATNAADEPACRTITEPPSRSTAKDIATATTRQICHGPLPMYRTTTSETIVPMVTPAINSPARRLRAPRATLRHTTAANGASSGCS